MKRLKLKVENTVWCVMHPLVTLVASSKRLSKRFPNVAEKWFDNPTSYMRF